MRGRIDLLQAPAVAVVGSRNPTPQGLDNARAFAAHLSQAGWVVVSGLALGVDAAAHEGALWPAAPARSRSSAPASTSSTRRATASSPHASPPKGSSSASSRSARRRCAENFPIRNRIIAGLARGTLVVEAAVQSGSLITARLAAEAGREVFAIPGSIHSPTARGCHALIKQGAKLVDSAADILDELPPLPGAGAGAARAPCARRSRRPGA